MEEDAAARAPTEMELRVAMTIWQHMFPEAVAPLRTFANEDARLRECYLDCAQTAIRAMREPTAAMRELDASLAPYWDNWEAPPRLCHKLSSHTGASWQAMIDAASPPEREDATRTSGARAVANPEGA